MLLANEDVGHRALAGELLQGVLHGTAVGYKRGDLSDCMIHLCPGGSGGGKGGVSQQWGFDLRTFLVELNQGVVDTHALELPLGGSAVGAVRLGEDDCSSFVLARGQTKTKRGRRE